MDHRRHTDTRDEVDGIVNRHQLDYSLGQLRLVGLVLLVLELSTLLLAGSVASVEAPADRLNGLIGLSPTLLLQGGTGAGLLLMQLRGRRQMQRLGLTPSLFFRTDATGPVQ